MMKNSYFKTMLILCQHVQLPDSLYKDRLAVAVFDKKKYCLYAEHTRYVNLVLYVAVSIFSYTRFFIRYGYFKVLSRNYAIILTFCNTRFTIRHNFEKKYVKAFLHAWDFGQS